MVPGMRRVVRYTRSSRRRQRRRSNSASAQQRQFNQRCAIRVVYSPNKTTGQWRAHGRYITRDSVMQDHEVAAIGNQGEVIAPPEALDRWQKAGESPEPQ